MPVLTTTPLHPGGRETGPARIKTDLPRTDPAYLRDIMAVAPESSDRYAGSLPFAARDLTAGVENEFQTVVEGRRQDVDLTLSISSSGFYRNLERRTQAGDIPTGTLSELERLLEDSPSAVWANSWVRIPENQLNPYARNIFTADLRSDKTDPAAPPRSDAARFHVRHKGMDCIRIPVSYLLKLALADALGEDSGRHSFLRITGEKMMAHFLNDNTSPETFSFYPSQSGTHSAAGKKTARETLYRFVLTQLLVQYAQDKFKLTETGQTVRIFFSASPPQWQQQLNTCIPDTFYRELFMSPCLSGWARGQDKHSYMKLCHKVLSRSRINSISKLKQAGIINSNLVVLPNSSNISLANNGTHISMGSRKLGRRLSDPGSGYTPFHEKVLGDLVIKITEHFLPLFPGLYSASPYRLRFEDFHPEHALGFLPHEIDYTHLRMIWRRWKKKARIHILGRPVTPFGPIWLDRLISVLFHLKGDYIPDFRLIDYFVSLMSTHESPALDGSSGNGDRLKQDLSQMGIFDTRMTLYQLVRIRAHADMGFTGFEHRYHSIFENLITDMGGALDLQNVITCLAYHYILSGEITHADIPDTPVVESERRQMFFGCAVDLPTFYIKTDTGNRFIAKIMGHVEKSRPSRRYPGYTRIKRRAYLQALVRLIKADARAILEMQRMDGVISDLEARLRLPDTFAASGRLVRGILEKERNPSPMAHRADAFNAGAEHYYIDGLRKRHMAQGIREIEDLFSRMDLWALSRDPDCRNAIHSILEGQDLCSFIRSCRQPFLDEKMPRKTLLQLIYLSILHVHMETRLKEAP